MKFEYKVARAVAGSRDRMASLSLQDLLSFYGDRGWAVVAIWQDRSHFGGQGTWVVFERLANGGEDASQERP